VKKAITHLKLDQANASKLQKLDKLAVEHQRVVQAAKRVNWLIAHAQRQPNKYADVPEQEVPTPLSDRWQRCAWQQACGIVQSWYANERENPPVLRNMCIQANANVVVIELSRTPQFDFWLRISTLEAGQPVRIPLSLYGRAKEALAEFPKLCTGVTLNQREGQWYATLVVERRGPQPKSSEVIGVDMGMANIVSTSEGTRYGQVSSQLRQRVERSTEKRRRKQKLNASLKRKGQATVDLSDDRAEAFARNEIGRALNQMLDERGLHYRSVQPTYSSQQCSQCGFTFPMNRRSQDKFVCLWCGYEANADENAASNLAERFGDEELNSLPFREVETRLALRFMQRLPDTRSASAGLDTRVNEVANSSPRSISPVKTPVSHLSRCPSG